MPNDVNADRLTFEAARNADPEKFYASCRSGGYQTQLYWQRPKPPAWLVDMDAAEFEAYLKRQEAKHAD